MDISCTKTVRHLSLLSTSLLFFAMGGSAGGAPLFLSANGCEIPANLTEAYRAQTDPNAPHTVASTELRSFVADFFYRDPYMPERSGLYHFSLQKENGAWRLTRREASIPIAQEAVDALERLIRQYDVASLNGVNEQIGGLPPEAGEYAFSAVYASGEEIHASDNRGTSKTWAAFRRPLLRYMDDLFIAAGHQTFAYPPEVFQIKAFSMEFHRRDGADTLIRYIESTDRQEVGADGRPTDVPCLMDTTMRKFPDGRLKNESERYLPYDEALLERLARAIEEDRLVERAENYLDLSHPQGDAADRDAFTIRVVYRSGRALDLDQKNKTNMPRETFLPTGILQWADTVFADAENEATE